MLRRCLVDRLEGTVTVAAADDRVPMCTIHVQNGDVVFVTSTVRPPAPGEGRAAYVIACIRSLAGLPEAAVGFEPGATPFAHPSPVPVERLIVEALRAEPDSARVEGWLGGVDTAMDVVADPFVALRGCTFDPAEGFFLSRIQGRIVPKMLVEEASIDPGDGVRLLCALRFVGALSSVARGTAWIGDVALSGDAPAAAAATKVDAAVDMADVMHIYYRIEEKLRAIEGGVDDYALLEVERRAPPDRIKASYRELLKTFHPDRHALLAAYAADVKQRLEHIVAELSRAYARLSNPKEREAYDQKLAKASGGAAAQKQQPPPAATPPAQSAPRPDARAAKPTPRPPVPKPIVEPLPKAPKPPPVVERPAERPAQSPIPPPEPRPPASAQPLPRPVATPQPARPSVQAAPTLDPAALFEKGAAYAGVGDFERAVRAFTRGVELAPQDARMHAALGSALADFQGLDREAEGSLRRAAELSPNSAELFVGLADVYRRFDRVEEACRLYKRALLIDPKNEEARTALDLENPPNTSARFFKRLFKRL